MHLDNRSAPTGTDLLGMALLAASGLVLELVLTRIFSVVLANHIAYAALGVAIAGLGLGAAAAYLVEPDLETGPLLSALAGGFALAVTRWFPPEQSFLFYGLLWGLPFVPLGWTISGIFKRWPSFSGRLYAADLAGAGAGALLAWVLLHAGAAEGVLSGAFMAASSGFLLRRSEQDQKWNLRLTLLVVVLFGILGAGQSLYSIFSPLPISPSPLKDRIRATDRSGTKILESRWSPFGRTDVVLEEEGVIGLYVDGAAGAVMLEYAKYGDLESPGGRSLATFPGSLPLHLTTPAQRDSILIIGAGGGRDVLLALQAGFRQITAVEVNPDIVQLGHDLAEFNGGIFHDNPRVRLELAEGRVFVETSRGEYDAIFLGLPVTKSSRAPFGYALTETFLITKESILSYWDHLSPEGRIIVVGHNLEEIHGLVRTSVEALKKRGMKASEVTDRTFMVTDHMHPIWVLNRQPVGSDMAYTLMEIIATAPIYMFGPGTWIPQLPMEIELTPREGDEPVTVQLFDPVINAIASDSITTVASGPLSGTSAPIPTDTRPYFYKEEPGLPGTLQNMIAFSLISIIVIGLWLIFSRFQVGERSFASLTYLTGTALGAGYLMVEVALFQQFSLLLGSPAYSITLLLPLLLFGSALGALWIAPKRVDPGGITRGMAAIAAVAVMTSILLGPFVHQIADSGAGWRLAAAAITTAVLGFVMGIPFPRLLLLISDRNRTSMVPIIWAGNAMGAVLGSALGLSVSVLLGYPWVFIVAAFIYISGAAAPIGFRRSG